MEKNRKKGMKPSYDEVIKKLADQEVVSMKMRLECERSQSTINLLLKENEELRKQVRDQKKESEKKSVIENEKGKRMNEELEKVQKELDRERIIKRYINVLGMDEKTADEAATKEIEKDMEAWHNVIERYVEKVRANAENQAIQEFLAGRTEIKGGNGDMERVSAANDIALKCARSYAGANSDILSHYI